MKHTLEEFQALRKQFGISTERAAIAIGIACDRKILGSKIERFERGSEPRSGKELNAMIKFYSTLERGIMPPYVPGPKGIKEHLAQRSPRIEGGKRGRPPGKRDALEALLEPGSVHIKKDGGFLSTSLAGEGISFFPEGQYLLQVDNTGMRVYSLASDSNPMAATLESTQAELEKYKKGWENWMALRDLVKD